jgi:rhomboid protease GluP
MENYREEQKNTEVQNINTDTESLENYTKEEADKNIPEEWEFLPSPRRRKTKFDFLPPKKFVIPAFALILICAFVTLFSYQGLLIDLSISKNDLTTKLEWWRGVSALFLHSGIVHLLGNTIGFLAFGWLLYGYFGILAFPILPLVFGILTNYLTVFSYSPNVKLVGISGMLYSMIALWLVLYLKFDTARKLSARVVRAVSFAALMLIPTQYDASRSDLAHGIGFVSGLVAGITYVPFAQIRQSLQGKNTHNNKQTKETKTNRASLMAG